MPMVQEIYEEKQVIEADVIESLPSVKKLAEIYATTPVDNNIPLNKPKVCPTFSLFSSHHNNNLLNCFILHANLLIVI